MDLERVTGWIYGGLFSLMTNANVMDFLNTVINVCAGASFVMSSWYAAVTDVNLGTKAEPL